MSVRDASINAYKEQFLTELNPRYREFADALEQVFRDIPHTVIGILDPDAHDAKMLFQVGDIVVRVKRSNDYHDRHDVRLAQLCSRNRYRIVGPSVKNMAELGGVLLNRPKPEKPFKYQPVIWS